MLHSRKKLAVIGFLTDFGGQILVMLLNIFTVPMILKFTSQTTYGFWLASTSIIGFLSLTDFGIGVPLTRAIASKSNPSEIKELNKIVSTGFVALLFIGVVFLLLGLLISIYISDWFNIPFHDRAIIIPAFLISVLSASLALPLGIFAIILNGKQRMAIDNTIRNTVSIVCIFITIFLLYKGFGLKSIALSNLILISASAFFNIIYLKNTFVEIKISFKEFDKKEFIKLLNFSGYFQIGRIANTVATSADNVIIASILGSNYVTSYSITSKLPTMFSINIASKLPIAVFPAISQMFEEKDFNKIKNIYIKLANFSIRLALIAAGFVLIANKEFINLWVGSNNFGGTALNMVFIYWILQDTIYRSTTALIYASGDLKKWSIASILEAILNILISIFLALKFGIIGVALGTAISKTLTTGISTPYFICKKIGMPLKFFIKKGIINPFVKSLPGILITWIIAYLMPINLGWFWIITVGLSIVLSNILIFEGKVLLNSRELTFKEKLNKILNFE